MTHTKELFSLEGRIAIVTGGRGRYGASIARGLCEMGASVVIASRNGAACDEYAETLRKEGYSAIGLSLDLGNDESIDALVNEVIARYGKIDILVNNAVDRSNLVALKNASREKLQASMQTNLTGQMILTQKVIPYMIEQKKGSIVNISSMRGIDCPHFPFYPESMREHSMNYVTEKWAFEGFTRYMAGRYGEYGIRTNSIAPGGFNPGLADKSADAKKFVETYIENCPLKSWADEDDIKGCVAFLASDASKYVTGATLVMDGGWTIW